MKNNSLDLLFKMQSNVEKIKENLEGMNERLKKVENTVVRIESTYDVFKESAEDNCKMDKETLEIVNKVNKEVDELQVEIRESLDSTRFIHDNESYLEFKTDKKVVMKMIHDGRSNEDIKRIFPDFPDSMIRILREQVKKEKQRRAGRGIKIKVTDDISHTGLTELEYGILSDHVDPDLKDDDCTNFILVVTFEGPEEVSFFTSTKECSEFILNLLETGVHEEQFRLFKIKEEINWRKFVDSEIIGVNIDGK